MIPTAADYVWFNERFPNVAVAYGLTYVRGLTPQDVFERLGATSEGECRGVVALRQATGKTWARYGGDRLLFGTTAIDGWMVAVECDGWLGVTESLLVPLSRGTTVVSHSRNVNAVGSFYWVEDGTIRLRFEPLFAFNRAGTDRDSVTDVMARVGFDLRSGEDHTFELVSEAAFALADHLTGVRLTPELLESATYQCGLAAPRA